VLPDGAKALAIVEAEAKIVRRIFREYAAGTSPREIAARLNSDGIPSPGASWNRNGSGQGKRSDGKWQSTAIHGHALRGTGILNNPRYAGRIEWGRTRWKRGHANSLKRKPIQEAAPFRLRTNCSESSARPLGGGQRGSPHSPGQRSITRRARSETDQQFTCCRVCSDAASAEAASVSSMRDYGCMTLKNGGASACSNDARIRRDELEQRVVADPRRATVRQP
jgi:hypothetical protein